MSPKFQCRWTNQRFNLSLINFRKFRKLFLYDFFLAIVTLSSSNAIGQVKYKTAERSSLQYGFTGKFTVGFEHGGLLLRAAAVGGIGVEMFTVFYPSYHLQLQIYNGGIGTAFKSPKPRLYMDLAHSLTLTAGGRRPYRFMNQKDYYERNSPLYHFSDFSYPALQNPFQYSVSLGTNLIHAFGLHRSKFQRAGFFDLHVGLFQFAYSNDGTPFKSWLADTKDRYYTGDGFIAINLPRKWEVNTYIFSYHKFTGYKDHAFEVANSLYLANVDYKDTIQQLFNRSVYSFSASSLDRGLAMSFDFRNSYFKDIQHLIHLNDYWVLHQVPYPFKKSLTATYFLGTSHLRRQR